MATLLRRKVKPKKEAPPPPPTELEVLERADGRLSPVTWTKETKHEMKWTGMLEIRHSVLSALNCAAQEMGNNPKEISEIRRKAKVMLQAAVKEMNGRMYPSIHDFTTHPDTTYEMVKELMERAKVIAKNALIYR